MARERMDERYDNVRAVKTGSTDIYEIICLSVPLCSIYVHCLDFLRRNHGQMNIKQEEQMLFKLCFYGKTGGRAL